MRVEGGAWEEVKRTKHTKALVTGLKSKKKYDFKVTATNSIMISLENVEKSETEWSKAARGAGGLTAGVILLPFVTAGMAICSMFGTDKDGKDKWSTATEIGTSVAAIPLSLLLSPVSVPVLSVWFAHDQMKKSYVGDLTPTSEDEEQ